MHTKENKRAWQKEKERYNRNINTTTKELRTQRKGHRRTLRKARQLAFSFTYCATASGARPSASRTWAHPALARRKGTGKAAGKERCAIPASACLLSLGPIFPAQQSTLTPRTMAHCATQKATAFRVKGGSFASAVWSQKEFSATHRAKERERGNRASRKQAKWRGTKESIN